jgi:Na+-transporting methylmalonyl-CoA/oxaloacetate decarboxylase gamma subunit
MSLIAGFGRLAPGERHVRGNGMDKWAFGFTMMIIGVGGTFLTLAILIWTVQILKKIFPLSAEGRPDKA